ncbi:MAG: hypothetical protein JW900_13210, partial [Anaerolineae bacterium]|nr:hypothetical protein [Anaerolineae bacterium]
KTLLKRSGGYKTNRRVPGNDCAHCGGTGREPDGWTYQRAQASPREFNLDRTRRQAPGAVPLLAHTVSPLHFDEQGREKCVKCNDLGHIWKLEEGRVEWPEFQPNAPGKLWHVERGGCILDGGIGLGPCAHWDREKAQAAVERIVERIEAAIQGKSANTTTAAEAAVTEATIRRNRARNGIEVAFPAKPPAEVRAGLKGLGFRWSRRQGLWYARFNDSRWAQVHELLATAAGDALVPEPVEPEPDPSPDPLPDAAVATLTSPVPETEFATTTQAPTSPATPQPALFALP